jgi:selenide,water dikinase
VLLDASTGDDAALYRLDDAHALVATVDFFTPIVDDPCDFGRIAAANALSDIYAMGARPLFALNVLAFPRKLLDAGILEEILRGGGEVARDAGIAIIGGHSIDDDEPKYGLCVIGVVATERAVRNSGARTGDLLVLTKPIGTGIITTAAKAEAASAETLRAAVAAMTTLNRDASAAMLEIGAHAATDVTGFGLLGHLHALLVASGAAARVHASAVPLLPGALELADHGHISGGTRRNREDASNWATWGHEVPAVLRVLLSDAQTSGGLLIAVPANRALELVERLRPDHPWPTAIIGEVVEGPAGTIDVVV